ncbi:uncharacterized protein LOC5577941 [Aedes aegypti]|uniref:Odorant receptor n=1 Tax=Aedes aegypti TaxID=7159 RepID=A0A1S4FZH5_AEDAE|nr:odorant receptor 77 [Aedes aegypti]
MATSLRASFPTNVIIPRCIPFIDRIQNPLALQKSMDRYFGVIYWGSRPLEFFMKIFSLCFMLGFLLLCFGCMFWVNPLEVPPDMYLNMWFYLAASTFVILQWITLFPNRHHYAKIVQYLSDLQRTDPFHPFRIRSRAVISLSTAFLLAMNTSMAIFWGFLLFGSCPMAFVFDDSFVKKLFSVIYPIQSAYLATLSNGGMVMCFAVLLVFTVEFSIIGENLREAFSNWNRDQIRSCIKRHQRLLEMVNLYRDKIRFFLLVVVGLYFLLVTFSSFLVVLQLHSGDVQALRYNVINAGFSIITIVLYGVVCDLLEETIREVGNQVYSSAWPSTLILDRKHRNVYNSGKRSLMMVIARSQQKVGFTCGSIYQMSTVTSMQVLKFCYSAFTVLWNATN